MLIKLLKKQKKFPFFVETIKNMVIFATRNKKFLSYDEV